MLLPSLIEIIPLEKPVQAEVTVPGSKSITNRALVLAALAAGTTTLSGALWSEDTQVMVDCLRKLGFSVSIAVDPHEQGNRTISVAGRNGAISSGGMPDAPLELFTATSGGTARFLAALLCLGRGVYRLSGTARMHERPQEGLFSALRDLGYRVDSTNGKLPVLIHGSGPRPGASCRVPIQASSQFASALLLSQTKGGWNVTVEDEDTEEASYVQMTRDLIEKFPRQGGVFHVEPDASSASYIWGADWLLKGSAIRVADWMTRSSQIDARFPDVIRAFPPSISRRRDLGDSIMTAIVLAPFADDMKRFVDLGRLRVQECERVQALHKELAKCGARISESGDALEIVPGPLHGADIDTYDDHRMAMCFGMLGLRVPGIRIHNPSCVNKTFPNFFEKLAAGLGATILDGEGRNLAAD